jgi:hypothetical protein
VRRAAAIIKAKIFISYNTAPQYVHPKRVGGKKGKEKGYGQLDGPRAGRRTPREEESHHRPRLLHRTGSFMAAYLRVRLKKIASFWSLPIQLHTRNSTEFPVGTAAGAGWLAGCPPPPHERIDRDGGENEPRNPAGNSARDLLIRQDRDMFPEKVTKRRAGTPIPGGEILPDGGGDAIPNDDGPS